VRAQGIGAYGSVGRNGTNGRHRGISVSNITNPNFSANWSSNLPHEQMVSRFLNFIEIVSAKVRRRVSFKPTVSIP